VAHHGELGDTTPCLEGRLSHPRRGTPACGGAVLKQLGSTDQKRRNREWRRRTDQRVGLVLDHVQQPFNVGGIVRTAAALRVEKIWAVGDTPDPTNRRVGKVALGTDRYLDWAVAESVGVAADSARDDGFTIVGLEFADGAQPVFDAHLGGDIVLVVGNEDRGLRPVALDACDDVVYVPQPGRVGSLNVAQATAIALYEVRRQGWSAAGD
jgi:tRNA (guanosine-2'-O-)-methyltransferase